MSLSWLIISIMPVHGNHNLGLFSPPPASVTKWATYADAEFNGDASWIAKHALEAAQTGNITEIIPDLHRAVMMDGGITHWVNLGVAYLRSGDKNKAADVLQRLLEVRCVIPFPSFCVSMM